MTDEPFVLGLDLDGVCADYIAEFRHHAARTLGVDPTTLPDPAVWNFADAGWGFTDLDHYLAVHHDAVRDGLFRALPPLPGVSDALWALSDAGIHIRVITHRLVGNHAHAVAAADTVAWLDRHRIPYRDLCFVGRKTHVDADVYIDDAPHNVESLRAGGGHVIVFDAPYNRHLPGPRAANWDEARDLVLAAHAAR